MYRLDDVNRLTPDSLDISREAVVRHAHVSALRHPGGRPRNGSAHGGLRRLQLAVGRLLPVGPGIRHAGDVSQARAT